MYKIIEKEGKEYLVLNDRNKFELVDVAPLGYYIWHIGKNMPEGYLPLCRMESRGSCRIDAASLKAYRMDEAQTVLSAIDGFVEFPIQSLAKEMEDYLRKSPKDGPAAFRFNNGQEMLDALETADLYNPITETYVFLYNNSGSIAVYTGIDTEEAHRLAKQAEKVGESMWSALLGPGGGIYDDPSYENFCPDQVSNLEYCESVFHESGWFNTSDWLKVSWETVHNERIRKAIPLLKQLRFEPKEDLKTEAEKNRYLVFLKAEYSRDAQGYLGGDTNNPDMVYDDDAWLDVSAPALLMDRPAGSVEELKQAIKLAYPDADMSVFEVLCVKGDTQPVSLSEPEVAAHCRSEKDIPCHFEAVVSACNTLKELWHFAQLVISYRSSYMTLTGQQAKEVLRGIEQLSNSMQDILSGKDSDEKKLELAESLLIHAEEQLKSDSNIAAFCNYFVGLKENLVTEGDNRRWYHDLEENLGNYWNEVPLPNCISAMFDAYVRLLAMQTDGMVGPEPADRSRIPENAWALSLYDLSDYLVVFESEDAVTAFADKHGVDPSDYMAWKGSCWCAV